VVVLYAGRYLYHPVVVLYAGLSYSYSVVVVLLYAGLSYSYSVVVVLLYAGLSYSLSVVGLHSGLSYALPTG
jgi:hypothetical protein